MGQSVACSQAVLVARKPGIDPPCEIGAWIVLVLSVIGAWNRPAELPSVHKTARPRESRHALWSLCCRRTTVNSPMASALPTPKEPFELRALETWTLELRAL